MDRCQACDLSHGLASLPGGLIHATGGWRVEHCVGPLGVGTLILKPERHVTAVADLTVKEASALGPLLRKASAVAARLVDARQVYNCLWSHAGGVPVHIHYVVQPVTAHQITRYGTHGPSLQVAMFAQAAAPEPQLVEAAAAHARRLFGESPHREAPHRQAR